MPRLRSRSASSSVSIEPLWSLSNRMKTRCIPWCCHQSRNSLKSMTPLPSASSSWMSAASPSASIFSSPSSRSSAPQSVVEIEPRLAVSYFENLACTESVRISAISIGRSKLDLS